MKKPIGLIAGNRSLPLMVAAKARELGRPLFVAGIVGEAEPELEKMAAGFTWNVLGQLRELMDFFLSRGVEDVLMIGGISRDNIIFHYEPDDEALELMSALSDFHTDRILRAVTERLEREGLRLRAVTELLPELLTAPGLLTSKAPDADLTADLKVAWRIAKELGRLDVGQLAVVSDRITVAVEAAEGTDEAVRRGAALAAKPVAVAKVVKPSQDLRLDPPVIGPDSIRVMAECRVGALAIDASHLLIIDRDQCLSLAEASGLAVVAWTDEMASAEGRL